MGTASTVKQRMVEVISYSAQVQFVIFDCGPEEISLASSAEDEEKSGESRSVKSISQISSENSMPALEANSTKKESMNRSIRQKSGKSSVE